MFEQDSCKCQVEGRGPGHLPCGAQRGGEWSVLALVTAKRENGHFIKEGAGVYRLANGVWELLSASHPFLWPKDFAVDPTDSRKIYVAASDARPDEQQGGLYRTTDGGNTWELLTRKGSEHFSVALHPKHAGWIYLTLCEDATVAGLWLSRDDGKSWVPFDDLPFRNIQRITFDPANDALIYLSTFGGSAWRGPAVPASAVSVVQ